MTIRFAPLFTLAVEHDYYASACRDLRFVVPASTSQVLRGARTIARELDGQLHLLAERDELGAPLVSLAGQTLELGLRIDNTYFDNFTVPALVDSRLTPLYANTSVPTELAAPTGVEVSARLRTHIPSKPARPVRLSLFADAGPALDTRTLPLGEEASSYDFRALPRGWYGVEEDFGGGQVEWRELLLADDVAWDGVWGVVRVAVDTAFYAAPPAFSVAFTARSETLRYYVVANDYTQSEFDQLGVTDRGFTEEGRAEIQFDKLLPAAFTAADLDPRLLGPNPARIVSFQSKIEVPRRERGPTKLQLSRNGSVLIEHLPTPGPERSRPHRIVKLSKP